MRKKGKAGIQRRQKKGEKKWLAAAERRWLVALLGTVIVWKAVVAVNTDEAVADAVFTAEAASETAIEAVNAVAGNVVKVEKMAAGETEENASGIDQYVHSPTLYLTFDDGPSKENTDAVLDVLKARNVKATFFVIGEYVRKYPETTRRIVEEGHTIGIHCDVHDYDVIYESVDSYVADFQKAYDTVREVTGVETKLFRFPGGSVNAYNKAVCEDIIEEMTSRGFVYFDWNASLEDAANKSAAPQQLVENAVKSTLGRKKVVLLAHDRVENTALCLNDLLDSFPEYQFEPLHTGVKPIQFKSPAKP